MEVGIEIVNVSVTGLESSSARVVDSRLVGEVEGRFVRRDLWHS